MKLSISKSDLENALTATSFALGRDNWQKNYFVRVTDNGVEFLTTNHRYVASAPVAGVSVQDKPDGDFVFDMESARIKTWLKNVNDNSALTLDTDGKLVNAKSTRGKVRWSCAQAKFPFFDDALKDAELLTTIKVETLYSLLNHHKHFVGKPDAKNMIYRYISVLGTGIVSGDGFSMSVSICQELGESKFFLTSLDLSPLLGFLKTLEGEVKILSKGRNVFFKGDNEAVFGLTIPSPKAIGKLSAMPVKNVITQLKDSVASFSLVSEDVNSSLGLLSSAMDATDEVVKFAFEGTDISLSGRSLAGDVDTIEFPMAKVNDQKKVLEEPMFLNRSVLSRVVSLVDNPDINVNITAPLNNSPVIQHDVAGQTTYSVIVPLQTGTF